MKPSEFKWQRLVRAARTGRIACGVVGGGGHAASRVAHHTAKLAAPAAAATRAARRAWGMRGTYHGIRE